MPIVTVVIPTRNRPRLLHRAIQSVLEQTIQDFEILIVIDGVDWATTQAVRSVPDKRIRSIELAQNVGLAEARNIGVRAASADWIALLDDDDEWIHNKLEKQLDAAGSARGEFVFVVSRFIEKTEALERTMPTRLPAPGENFSEYIYCRGGYLQPSMYLASRTLMVAVPFTKGLRHIEDTDWLLRVTGHPNISIVAVPDALSIYNNVCTGERESETTPWRQPLEWGIANHALFSRRAFPFFVARLCVNARRSRDGIFSFCYLFYTASRYGSITPKVILFFISYSLFSTEALKKLAAISRGGWRRAPNPLHTRS
jgi:glycosyltransferase involved in cell wall biosynthesis